MKQRGFTIVELLIVVVVIAILAVISIVSYNGISNRAKDAAKANEVAQVEKRVLTNQITSGSNSLLATPSGGGAPATPSEFLQLNGLSVDESKTCVAIVHDVYGSGNPTYTVPACHPAMVEGQATQFNKELIYLRVYYTDNAVPPVSPSGLEVSYWSTTKQQWVGKDIDTQSSWSAVCYPFRDNNAWNGTTMYYPVMYNSDCETSIGIL